MGKNPAFQFYPADWSRDLDDQELEIEGAWIRICCRLWWSETPGDATKPLSEWARILRKSEKKTEKFLKILLEKGISSGAFLDNQNVNLICRRMKRDVEISKLRREVGKLGGNPKLQKQGPDLLNQTANQNPTPSSSSLQSSSSFLEESSLLNVISPPKKSTPKDTPPTPSKPSRGRTRPARDCDYSEDFEQFWKAYPKKAGKPDAWEAWKKLNGTRPDVQTLLDSVRQHASSDDWTRERGRFIPWPQKFLNGRRWEDEITELPFDQVSDITRRNIENAKAVLAERQAQREAAEKCKTNS